MKRIFLIVLVLCSIILAGCSLLFGKKENNEIVGIDVPVNSDGEVYLVKLNMSNKIIKGDNTGYVAGVTRSASDQPENNEDSDRFIRDLSNSVNQSINDYLNNSARAAADESSIIVTGYSNKQYSQNEQFWSYVNVKQKSSLLRGKYEVNVPGKIDSELKYEGDYCYVYADKNNNKYPSKGIELADDDYVALGKKFDACYKLETKINGNPCYEEYNSELFVPCNEKIVILVSDLFGDAEPDQQSGTVGYFFPSDLFKQSILDENYNTNYSETDDEFVHANECEMFYIDALFLTKERDIVYSTLVHEFNHMINYVIKSVNYMNDLSHKSLRLCDTWFTEMLSMTTEDMFQKYLEIDDAHSPKARLPNFSMAYYYGFKNWDDKSVDQLIFYANTYAFGAFLARNFGGVELVKEIAQNDAINEQSITKAIQALYPDESYEDELSGKIRKWDYTYALRQFTMCIIDTEDGWTLNKGTKFTSDNLGFSPISLKGTAPFQGQEYEIPFKFKKDAKIDLYPTGFTVHTVGTNIKSFKLAASNNTDLEYYLIIR